MKAISSVVIAASVFAAATAAWSGPDSVSATAPLVPNANVDSQPLFPATPYAGYVVYSGYAGPLAAPSCYWTRLPVYDAERNVVGWRGRPVAICPQVRISAQVGN